MCTHLILVVLLHFLLLVIQHLLVLHLLLDDEAVLRVLLRMVHVDDAMAGVRADDCGRPRVDMRMGVETADRIG